MRVYWTKYSSARVLAEACLYVDGWTYQEIADSFGMPLSTVGWHIKYRLKDVDEGFYRELWKNLKGRDKNGD